MAKFIACGDLHLTDKKPKSRKDENYMKTCLKKLAFILDYAVANYVDAIVQPGDFTNKENESYELCSNVISLLTAYQHLGINLGRNIQILCSLGQHDTPFHNIESKDTIHNALRSAGFLTLLGKKPIHIKGADFYGCSWGEEVPKILDPENYSILAIHKMIVDEKLWEGQKDCTAALPFLRETKFDFIVSGDNHTSFSVKSGGRRLVNCGSLMRSTVAQKEHLPHFWVVDTWEETCTKISIPVKKADEVLRYEEHEQQKLQDQDIEDFAASISSVVADRMDFRSLVETELKRHKVAKEVAQIVRECVNEEG